MANTNPQMQQITPLQDLGLMELISGETTITSEVTTYPTPGHTPGHTSLLKRPARYRHRRPRASSGSGRPHRLVFELRHRCRRDDRYAPKKRWFDQTEAEGLITAFCHFPDPFGKLVRAPGKRNFQRCNREVSTLLGPSISRDAVPDAKMRPPGQRSAGRSSWRPQSARSPRRHVRRRTQDRSP